MSRKKFNTISIEIIEGTHYDSDKKVDRVKMLIDDVEFLTWVSNYEIPMMKLEGRREIREMRVYPPANRRTISILRGISDHYSNIGTVVDCECECWGCWPVTAKIIRLKSIVKWKKFENDHRSEKSLFGHWTYDGVGPFVFERAQYDRELSKIPTHKSGTLRGRLRGY